MFLNERHFAGINALTEFLEIRTCSCFPCRSTNQVLNALINVDNFRYIYETLRLSIPRRLDLYKSVSETSSLLDDFSRKSSIFAGMSRMRAMSRGSRTTVDHIVRTRSSFHGRSATADKIAGSTEISRRDNRAERELCQRVRQSGTREKRGREVKRDRGKSRSRVLEREEGKKSREIL